MVTQLAAQDLESQFKNNKITMLKALVSSKLENLIRKHRNNNIRNMSLTRTLILLCIDDGAIPFESRRDAKLGIQIIKKVSQDLDWQHMMGEVIKVQKQKYFSSQAQEQSRDGDTTKISIESQVKRSTTKMLNLKKIQK